MSDLNISYIIKSIREKETEYNNLTNQQFFTMNTMIQNHYISKYGSNAVKQFDINKRLSLDKIEEEIKQLKIKLDQLKDQQNRNNELDMLRQEARKEHIHFSPIIQATPVPFGGIILQHPMGGFFQQHPMGGFVQQHPMGGYISNSQRAVINAARFNAHPFM